MSRPDSPPLMPYLIGPSWREGCRRAMGHNADPQVLEYLQAFSGAMTGENRGFVKWLGGLPAAIGTAEIPATIQHSIQHGLALRPTPGDSDGEMDRERQRVTTQIGMWLGRRDAQAGRAVETAAGNYESRADQRAMAAERLVSSLPDALQRGPDAAVAWAEKAGAYSRQDWTVNRGSVASRIEKFLDRKPPEDAPASAQAARGALSAVREHMRGEFAVDRGSISGAVDRFRRAKAEEGGAPAASTPTQRPGNGLAR